ncbi:MAG TPA: AI-2E family transporter [Candidatus Saccharimonadales bacterium]|nr:AI-2E family transporter [Candidatus Saccharimonadales bacterium]
MLEELKKELSSIKLLTTLLIIAVVIYLLQIAWQIFDHFSDIIIMFIIAWLLSFILEPVVQYVSRFTRLSIAWATLIVYISLAVILGGFIYLFTPELTSQFQTLTRIIPDYLASSPKFIQHAADSIFASMNNFVYYVPNVAQFLFSLFITLIISIYFIVDKDHINDEIMVVIPKKWHSDVRYVQRVISDTFASFLRVQLIFGIMAGIATFIVLLAFGVDFAASTAILAGILTVIPLVGPILGIIPPVMVGFITDPSRVIFIFVILLIIQQVIFNVIGPRLMGKTLHLHPVVVLVSFLVGLKVGGAVGGVFAVPVLGAIIIILRQVSRYYQHATKS